MMLVPLDRAALAPLWPLLRPLAEQMAERFPDDWPVPEIVRQARAGTILLWLAWEPAEGRAYGLIGTEIHDMPSGRRALVVSLAAGGEHERWVHLMADLERHGARYGCDYAEVRGRSGWARHLTSYRSERGVILRKDLR